MVIGVLAAQNATSSTYRSIETNGNPSGYDDANTFDTITYKYTKAGFVEFPPYGTWFNPKALGRSEPPPQVSYAPPTVNPKPKPDCPCDGSVLGPRGEPIDLGTGNMYEQVTDYTTVGQNPLVLDAFGYLNSWPFFCLPGGGWDPFPPWAPAFAGVVGF